METVGELASGVAGGGRPGKGSGCPAHGRKRGAGRPPDLLGQDQLVVAGMPQPIALVAVADKQFALALEQAGAVDFAGFGRGRAFGGVERAVGRVVGSEEATAGVQSLMRSTYAVCR